MSINSPILQQFYSQIIRANTFLLVNHFSFLQLKVWFQNHRYKYKRQAKEKSMTESSPNSQVRKKLKTTFGIYFLVMTKRAEADPCSIKI